MNKGYIVLEVGWEYNDEYYYSGNGNTYEAPSEVFTDKEKADALCKKRNIKAYKGTELASYIQDLGDELVRGYSEDDIYDYIEKTFGEEANREYFEYSVPMDATDKQVEGLMKMLKLRFFVVKSVNIK
jgi:hypothetical protein